MEKANINGEMEDHTMENGVRIRCMDMVYLPGSMEENSKGNMSMIRRKASAYFIGMTAVDTRDNGKMANSMEMELTTPTMAKYVQESGKMVK